jgi:hypothetical protein
MNLNDCETFIDAVKYTSPLGKVYGNKVTITENKPGTVDYIAGKQIAEQDFTLSLIELRKSNPNLEASEVVFKTEPFISEEHGFTNHVAHWWAATIG